MSGRTAILQIVFLLVCVLSVPLQTTRLRGEDSTRPELLLVMGAPGLREYEPVFREWADRWITAAKLADADLVTVGLPSSTEPSTDTNFDGENSETERDRLLHALAAASISKSREPLWLIFIGHATWDQKTARLNLNGPDVSADEMAAALAGCSRPVIAAFCSSSSSPFLNALSARGRVIITATRDGTQSQYSRFGDAFSAAITSTEADRDQDGQTSVLEAWRYASRRTAEFYEEDGRLATEHSLLDDTGDQRGIRAEALDSTDSQQDSEIDGALAATICFVRSAAERRMSAEQRLVRDALEARLRDLRRRRSEMDETDYLQRLEDLLVPLSRLYETAAAP